jgi:predicted RND superfamily exporter protein
MTKLAHYIIRHRLALLIAAALLTVFFAYQLTKLRIDSDILNYLPQDDPVVELFREVGDKYGGSSLAVVALETEDVFNLRTLARIDSLTTRFHDLPEVSQVTSLTDVLDIKKIPDGIEVGKLIRPSDIPDTPQDLTALREYTLSKEMYRGNIVSADGRTTLLLARVRDGVNKTDPARKSTRWGKQDRGCHENEGDRGVRVR